MASDNKEETNRMWANASFVCVLIVIGLPLWWKTTEVYRVALPYDKINAFDPSSLSIATELIVLAYDETTAAEVIRLIENTFKDIDIIKLKIVKTIMSDKMRHTVNSAADEEDAVDELSESIDLKKANTIYVVQRKPLFQHVWLGDERVVFFRDSKAAQTLVEALVHWVYQVRVVEGARSDVADAARRTRVPPGPGYHVVLSVAHPRPDTLKVDFDAGAALEDYIGSFADELSVLHNFTLKSQWLYLLDFDFQAAEVKDSSEWGRHFGVRARRLPQLLTRLEERAATRVAQQPAVNLVLFAVPCDLAPLFIYDNDDNKVEAPTQAFMSPKWGGVVLGNPTKEECDKEKPSWRPPVRIIMGTFISQLRKLLGISTDMEGIAGAGVLPLRGVSPRAWELDATLRVRTLEHAASARNTLRSLAQLLGKISNIVINDEVGASINTAVENIELTDELMARGELLGAYEASLRAYLAAETAFMEPSLLALLYFPDDQKYAIYIPLFLPIMFPVVLSLKTLLLWLRGHEKTE